MAAIVKELHPTLLTFFAGLFLQDVNLFLSTIALAVSITAGIITIKKQIQKP